MQLEEQNQAVVVSENAPQADSTPTKKQHGGKRAGSGRKPNISAEKVLTEISKLAFLDIFEENVHVTGLEGLAERLADIRKRKNEGAL